MSTNYQKGYQFEYKVKNIFEEKGWTATRSPASQSPADLYVMGKEKSYLVQCKTTSKDNLYVYNLDNLKEKSEKTGAIPLLVYSLRYTPPYVKKIKGEKEKVKRDENHKKLKEYLEENKP